MIELARTDYANREELDSLLLVLLSAVVFISLSKGLHTYTVSTGPKESTTRNRMPVAVDPIELQGGTQDQD